MRALLIAATVVLGAASAAAAQPYRRSAAPHPGTVELGGSLLWSVGYDAGNQSALETPNTTTGASPLTLFTTDSRVVSGIGGEARLGVYLSRRVSAEAAVQISRPVLRTRLGNDFENAAPETAEEVLTSYVAGGTLLYHFGRGPLVPFVGAGAAYLRQLHEDNADVLTGTEIHGGGGLKVWMGKGVHRFGLRFDAQASSRSRSAGFEQKRRIVPVASVGVAYLF